MTPMPIIYSEKDKWFFVHIPKNGGTAVTLRYFPSSPFMQKDGIHTEYVTIPEKHNTPQFFIEKFPKLKNYEQICLVRNPWARCLSFYTFQLRICLQDENLNKNWSVAIHTRLTREGFKGAWMPGGFWRDEDNMKKALVDNPGREYLDNWPQCKWITNKSKVFKLETQLEEMYDFMKIPIQRNAKYPDNTPYNKSMHYDYRKYYDDELKNEIAKLYKEDIERFGYTF